MPGERISEATMDTIPAAADLSTHQYKAVKLTATGVDVCAAGDPVYGVLTNKPASGNGAAVEIEGIAQLVVNGNSVNIAAGDPLESTTAGIGIKSTADKKNVFAIAREAAVADGVIISVVLTGPRQASV